MNRVSKQDSFHTAENITTEKIISAFNSIFNFLAIDDELKKVEEIVLQVTSGGIIRKRSIKFDDLSKETLTGISMLTWSLKGYEKYCYIMLWWMGDNEIRLLVNCDREEELVEVYDILKQKLDLQDSRYRHEKKIV